jgi:uncharacterized membrane protein (UPF0182 family)
MTLADLTALFSRVSRENPKMVDSREVSLFIQACIERQRLDDGLWPVASDVPIAPVDDPNGV